MGTAVTAVALPLVAIYRLRASTFEVGLVSAATVAAWLFIGLPAGVIVHRLPLRRALVTADLVRAAALASVPVAAGLGLLTLPQLVLVALVIGIASVLFDVGFATYIPSVVPSEQLVSKNSLLQGSESVSQVAGPALGGALVQLIGAATTLFADVISYLVSASFLMRLGKAQQEEEVEPPTGGFLHQVGQGLGFVRRDRVVGPFTLAAASLNFTGAAITALSTVFLVRTLHASATLVGVLLACEGLGGVLGAALAGPLTKWLGSGRAAITAIVAAPLAALLIPLSRSGAGLLFFVAGEVGLAAATVIFSVLARSHRQTAVPRNLLARVMATVRFVSWGVLPLGGLVGGTLGQLLGVRAALWIICLVLLLGPVPVLLSPVRTCRDLLSLVSPPPAPGAPLNTP